MSARRHADRGGAALISATLDELAAAARNEATLYFVRISVPSGQSPWVEAFVNPLGVGGLLNVFYPFRESPLERLVMAGLEPLPGMQGVVLYPHACCMFSFAPITPPDLAAFVELLFIKVFGCEAAGYPVDVDVESRPLAS